MHGAAAASVGWPFMLMQDCYMMSRAQQQWVAESPRACASSEDSLVVS